MKHLNTPAAIGTITGFLMIVFSFIIYRYYGNFETNLQYVTYATYWAGIAIAQFQYRKKGNTRLSFRHFFMEGCKVLIVVTLLMTLFTIIFLQWHPELKEGMAQQYREQLTQEGNRTPEQILKEVELSKERYLTFFTSVAIFGYLMIGSLASLVGGIIFSSLTGRKNDKNNFNR